MSKSALTDRTVRFEPTARPSEAVIAAVADAEGVDATELDPLFAAVDPDALDRLFDSHEDGDPLGVVRFRYQGYEVAVHADARIELDG